MITKSNSGGKGECNMKFPDRYHYIAIFHYAEDGISIRFPDLPGCLPCAHSEDEAVKNAQEALGLHIFGMEQDNDPIPEPTPISMVALNEGEVPVLVSVLMPPMRDRIKTRYIKKTLSIPAGLNAEAEEQGINFSQVLQEALRELINQYKTV